MTTLGKKQKQKQVVKEVLTVLMGTHFQCEDVHTAAETVV